MRSVSPVASEPGARSSGSGVSSCSDGGGPGGSTETMSTLLYKSAFQFNEFGYGIAMALVLAIVVAIFSVMQYRLSNRKAND